MKKRFIEGIYFLLSIALYPQSEDYIDYSAKDTKLWLSKMDKEFPDTQKQAYSLFFEQDFRLKNSTSVIKIEYNEVIEKNIKRYLDYKWLPKVFGLLAFYRPMFLSKLKKYNLPKEILYLAIVESNLNPRAVSGAGAMGLWQFMPATGQKYGLFSANEINTFYDPTLSTEAACKHLKYLYEMLGDWNLALSAYNAGLGNVHKAILKAQTDDYWQVRKFLPSETRAYVPAFHAIKYIGEHLSLFYKSIPQLKYSYADISEEYIQKPTTFKDFAKENKHSLHRLYFFNPHILTEKVPHRVMLYFIHKKTINE